MTGIVYSIFFSWQSDLPNSETRGLIQSSIDAAVKGLRDTVFVEADRDMSYKALYGICYLTSKLYHITNKKEWRKCKYEEEKA